MANTPYESWAGTPHFGLRELLELGRNRSENTSLAVEELNRALDSLGITNFRVEKIVCESLPGEDVSQWVITLASVSDRAKTFSLEWKNGAAK